MVDKKSLKETWKISGIFLLIFLVFVAISIKPLSNPIEEIIFFNFIFLIILLSFLFIFYFLVKYQKEEYHSKKIFWKLPLISIGIGALSGIILFAITMYIAVTCSGGESCMGVGILAAILLIAPTAILLISSVILSFNSWYRTNLYTVAWTGFVFVLIHSIWSLFVSYYPFGILFAILFGFLAGTILAINLKKTPEEISSSQQAVGYSDNVKKTIKKGVLFGGIISLIWFMYLIISILPSLKLFSSMSFYNILLGITPTILGAIIGFVVGKIKYRSHINE